MLDDMQSGLMKSLILLITLLVTYSAPAKTTPKGYNTLGLALTGSRYLNRGNVSNFNQPGNPLSARNTNGFELNLLYNRVTRYNLILEFAVGYGQQSHDISIRHNLENFDPRAVSNLKGAVYGANISETIKYFAPRVAVGYKYRLNGEVSLIGKGGIKRLHYLNGKREVLEATMAYYTDDHSEMRIVAFNNAHYVFGEEPGSPKASGIYPFNAWLDSWDIYLGVQKEVKSFWISAINLGLTGTATFGKVVTPSLTNGYLTRFGQTSYMYEGYYMRNRSVGLVLGVVF
jgi:hypothetical protein